MAPPSVALGARVGEVVMVDSVERITSSALAAQAVDRHFATREDLAEIADGWRHWAAQPDGWFAILHGEMLCRD